MFLLREALVPGSTQMIKRLILFGESDLYSTITTLTDSFVDETTVNKIYLPALTMQETTAYLQHRLEVAGYTGEKLFSSSVVEMIHQTSGGFPGPMNEIADQWLKKNYSNKKKRHGILRQKADRPRRIFGWVAAGILVLLLAVLLYYPYRKASLLQPEERKVAGKVFRAKIPQIPESTGKVFRAKIPQIPESTGKIFRAKIPAVKHLIKPPAKAETTPPVQDKTVPSRLTAALPDKVKTQQKAELQQEAVTLPEKIEPQQETKLQQQAATSPQKTEPQQETKLQRQATTPPVKIEPQQKTKLQQQAATPPKSTLPTTKEKVEKRKIHRENWLLSQDSDHYTIQIIAGSMNIFHL